MDGIIRGRGRPLARPDDGQTPTARKSGWKRPRALTGLALLATVSVAVSVAYAVGGNTVGTAVPPTLASSTQFDITGFLQDAKLGGTHTGAGTGALQGGTLQINGQNIIVPSNLVVILPASAMTWQELFKYAPSPYGLGSGPGGVDQTGLALDDNPRPLGTYEVHVVGNRVIDNSGDHMIAGMVHIAQQDLNSGAGYVNFIDYTNGFMYVGGTVHADGSLDATNPGTKVSINDPDTVGNADVTPYPTTGGSGRFGRVSGSDRRFQVDQDNPTILAETGFPMCLPRVAPTLASEDVNCPEESRPRVKAGVDESEITPNPNPLNAGEAYRVFRMDSPANVDAGVCPRTTCADPRKQAPFEIGDYISFTGNLVNDTAPFTAGPTGGATINPATTHIEAHTIVASLGIYTQPGIDPAYVSVDVSLIGTGGLTIFGAGEAAVRTKFEGMTTDETRMISLYGIDINPTPGANGATTDREWGNVLPDPGPPGGAVRGRWRFRPPCTDTLVGLAAKPGKGCTPPPAGQFIPPTQEVRAVIQPDLASLAAAGGVVSKLSQTSNQLGQFLLGGIVPNPNTQIPNDAAAACTFNAAGVVQNHPCTTANGIFYGQYHAPIGEFIFPENVPGTAVPENNFNAIPFLANGGYQSITGVQAGVLDPWPSNNAPAGLVCASPTMIGAPYTLTAGTSLQLSGSLPVGVTLPVTLQWSIVGGGVGNTSSFTGATTTTPTFNTGNLAPGTYTVNFEANNLCGLGTATSTITIVAAVVTPPPSIKPIQNQTVTSGTGVGIIAQSDQPATFNWIQTGGPVVGFGVTPSGASTSVLNFVPPVSGVTTTYVFTVTATNVNGTSQPVPVSVTATPSMPVNITFGGTLEYRIAKQRLVMTATSTDPTVTSMVLQPYLTESGTIFDPVNLGAGLTVSLITPGSFTITLVGAPKPACNLGGTYATVCGQTPITVKAVHAGTPGFVGTSAPTALQKIRQ